MQTTYLLEINKGFEVVPDEPLAPSLFKEYERVIVETIVTSFGLDFLINDKHGGDVDTIHNVRKIGEDKEMKYKNTSNETAYKERGDYNHGTEYRSDSRYIKRGAEDKAKQQSGNLEDVYRNNTMKQNENRQLDHVISASEIHNDRGRVLAGVDGVTLANEQENLQSTHGYINRIKSNHTTQEFLDKVVPKQKIKLQDTLEKDKHKLKTMPSSTPEEKHKREMIESKIRKNEENLKALENIDAKAMEKADKKARKAYEQKIAREYYISPQFAKDTAVAAATVGLQMGTRQALGFVFAEMWFAVKEEFEKLTDDFDFKDFLNCIASGLRKGYENARKNYKELFHKFLSGTVAGALSSITTTLCNIFFTTAKRTVKILRQTYASLVEALKILFINPDNLLFGERVRSMAKVLATGASVVMGVIVSELLQQTPIAGIPYLGEIIQNFLGAFVTGIMTCTLLYYLDRSDTINKLVVWLNKVPTIDVEVQFFRNQAKFFEKYAAELMKIDIEQFEKEVGIYSELVIKLEETSSPEEVNTSLKSIYTALGIKVPWDGDFNDFMTSKKTLTFS